MALFSVTGDRKLDRALKKLTDKESKKLWRAAVRSAAASVAKETKAQSKRTPYIDSVGALERSIGVKSVRRNREGGFTALIGPRSMFIKDRKASKAQGENVFKQRFKKADPGRNPQRYGHLIEFGTKKGTPEYRVFRIALFGKEARHRNLAVEKMRKLLPAAVKRSR